MRSSQEVVWPSRRNVLRGALALLALPWLACCRRLAQERLHRERAREAIVPLPDVDGVHFHDDLILVRKDGEVAAYSSRCPHLGCRIGRVDPQTSVLVCPCHGSRFDQRGRRVAGPARSDLQPLPIANGDRAGTIRIVLRG